MTDFDLSEEEEEEETGGQFRDRIPSKSRDRTPSELIEGKQGGRKRQDVEGGADSEKKNADRETVNSYVPGRFIVGILC